MVRVQWRWGGVCVLLFSSCLLLVLSACGSEEAPAAELHRPEGPILAATEDPENVPQGEALATINVPELNELSGLAASRAHPGIFWAHNDSGDTPRVFAFDINGEPRGIFRLAGARAEDWEGMAVGPGPEEGRSYLYLGDIGDNFGRRPNVVVYRIAEPAPGTPGEVAIPGVEAITLRYPGTEAHNAEALMVDAATGDLYVVTKSRSGPALVYRAAGPLMSGALDLERVAELALDGPATAADIAPDGRQVVIRTYDDAYLWERPAGTSIAEALAGAPLRIPLEFEPQGEAIAFAADGASFLTASEGRGPILYRYALWEVDDSR